MNFGKHFSKTIRVKLEFQACPKKTCGRRENFDANHVKWQTKHWLWCGSDYWLWICDSFEPHYYYYQT
jgi:hypothetical protein